MVRTAKFSIMVNRYILTVFEINGAHGARRAQFRRRAHDFRHCASDVCMFFQSVTIQKYRGVHWEPHGSVCKKSSDIQTCPTF